MASSIIKTIGFIYYTVSTTTIAVFMNFFVRLGRRPNVNFFITNKALSRSVITLYSLINLFVFYYFYDNKLLGYSLYLANEFITIAFSYFILNGFHVYGITGQICSGKTAACNYLKRKYKATIISLDEINHDILRQYSTIQEIKKVFGNSVISNEYGIETINKNELKKIVFKDKHMKKQLENITHPKIFMQFFKTLFIERFINMKKYVFIENAILLRFKLFKIILKGVITICVGDENILIQRMIKRDNNSGNQISEETAKNILKNQMPLFEFKAKSDIVIYNNENYQNLELQLDSLMRHIERYS